MQDVVDAIPVTDHEQADDGDACSRQPLLPGTVSQRDVTSTATIR